VKKPDAIQGAGTQQLRAGPLLVCFGSRQVVLDKSSLTSQYFPYYDVRSIERENTLAVATLTSKGQITIPSRVRAALGLEAGDRVEFVEQEKGQFAIVAATRSVQELRGLFRGKRSKPVSIEEMNAAIARRASGSR
jgi:AbrB family looped-hinge helix DNA binding protein